MRVFTGIDLGSTTTKAVLLDESENVLGRGIINSRSNYELAASIARSEARASARFWLLEREFASDPELAAEAEVFKAKLNKGFRRHQLLAQIDLLRDTTLRESEADRVKRIQAPLIERIGLIMKEMDRQVRNPTFKEALAADKKKSDFFRDQASSSYAALAEEHADETVTFDDFMAVFDKAIIQVENTPQEDSFAGIVKNVMVERAARMKEADPLEARRRDAVERSLAVPIEEVYTIGTGYGRATLPFPREHIRSEILCHGLGAHKQFPHTATVLDIGGQDTKAIQVDSAGIVTSFQMNDRCAAGCGRYLGYIADEMNMGVHELGPIALKSERHVKISSTCTVFAGAELRDRLSNGQRREDILAGLHRAIILRAMSLLARSGGVHDEFTFTGGVANNGAAVKALQQLVKENYGDRTLNISPGSIYTGALGAALFAMRADAAPSIGAAA